MEDAELRNILFSIQGSIAGFQNDMSDVKNDIADMKTDIANMKTDITNMKTDLGTDWFFQSEPGRSPFRKHELGFQNRIWSGWNLRTLSSDLLR